LRAVHASFRLSHTVVRVAIIGMDELGRSLLKLLETQRQKLRSVFEIDIRIFSIVTFDKEEQATLISLQSQQSDSITKEHFEKAVLSSSDVAGIVPGGLSTLASQMLSGNTSHMIIFDCTSFDQVSKYHPSWLRSHIHVITANNTGLSGSYNLRSDIQQAETEQGKRSANYLREVTVGGAMPVINSLQELLISGDKIRRIDGILSVSMSYILHRIAPPPNLNQCQDFDEKISQGQFLNDFKAEDEKCSLSKAVSEAIALGLMEEDPLKDLNNEYTARCLMVLAKELGLADEYDVEKIQLNSETLIVGGSKTKIQGIKYEEIVDQLDRNMKKIVEDAAKEGCVPRHVSSIDVATGEIRIAILNVPSHHIFAITPPSCECVRFFTERHNRYPLIIQGPSAGAESTASGLLAELLRLMRTKVGVKSGALSRIGSSAMLT